MMMMRISRTTHPRWAQSLSLWRRKKKKHLTTDNQRFKPCQVLLSPLYSHSSQLLLISHFPLSSPDSFSIHFECPTISILLTTSHLILSVFRNQIFICCVAVVRNRWTPCLCQAAGNGVCVYVWHLWSIRYKVHADLQRVMLLYVFITLLWRDKQGTEFLISWRRRFEFSSPRRRNEVRAESWSRFSAWGSLRLKTVSVCWPPSDCRSVPISVCRIMFGEFWVDQCNVVNCWDIVHPATPPRSHTTPFLIIHLIWEDVYQQEASPPYFLWHFPALCWQEPAPSWFRS